MRSSYLIDYVLLARAKCGSVLEDQSAGIACVYVYF